MSGNSTENHIGALINNSEAAALMVSQPSVMPATPFHTAAYLMAYRRHFGRGKRFYRIKTGNGKAFLMARGRTARRVEWWGAGIHDVGGGIYNSPHEAFQLWRQIKGFARHRHGARLAQIPANSLLIQHAIDDGWHVEDAEVCPVLELPRSWDEYLKILGRNMREQIRRYPKRLEKKFFVEYELARDQESLQVGLDNLFRLHGKRWRARGQTGVLATPRRQHFHRDVCRTFLQRGWLRLWTLRCNGEAVCVLLNYSYNQKYFFFIGGFDPAWSRWSVGTCLFARVFQHAIEEGSTNFDFLRGAESYKYRYGATDRHYKTISWYQNSPRGHLLHRRIRLENELQHQIHKRFSAAER